MARFQITIDSVPTGDGDIDVPFVNWESDTYTVAEGDTLGNVIELRVQLTDVNGGVVLADSPVTVPFAISGTAEHGTDYVFKSTSNINSSNYTRAFITIPAGSSFGSLFLGTVPNVVPDLDRTVILTLSADNTVGLPPGLTGAVLNGAELGTGFQVATTTVTDDDSATITVAFRQAASLVLEPDTGSVIHSFWVDLDQPVPPAGPTVDFDVVVTGGDAATGIDFSGLPQSVSLGPGQSSFEVRVLILGDLQDEGNEFFTVTIQNLVGGVLGAPSVHTVTIQDNDAPSDDAGFLNWDNPNPEPIKEGSGQKLIGLKYEDASGNLIFTHTDFTVNFVLGGSATIADDYTLDNFINLSIPFNSGDARKNIRITPIADGVFEGVDETVTITLDPTPPLGTITPTTDVKTLVITDVDQPPLGDPDGDPLDFEGNRLWASRQPFDASTPDLRVLPNGHSLNPLPSEAVVVVSARAASGMGASQGAILSPDAASQSVYNLTGVGAAMQACGRIWKSLYDLDTKPQSEGGNGPEIGEEYAPIKVEVIQSEAYQPANHHDPYIYRGERVFDGGASYLQILFTNLGSASVNWTKEKPNADPNMTVVRDVVVYAAFGPITTAAQVTTGAAFTTPRTVTLPKLQFGNGSEGRVDNLRFERCTHLGDPGSGSATQPINVNGGGTGYELAGGGRASHGRVKLYDFQMGSLPGVGKVTRAMRCGPTCWDLRHPYVGMPWPPFFATGERPLYMTECVGPVTYAALDYNWHVEVPTTGVHANALAANCFLNLYEQSSREPWNGGAQAFSPSGFIQFANRPNYSPDSDMSSGLMVFYGCTAGAGDDSIGGDTGTTYAMLGHNGQLYWKDCTIQAGPTGKSHGGIKLWQDGPGNESSGPQGRFRIGGTGTPATDRTYIALEVYIDGLIFSSPNATGKTGLELSGVQKTYLIGFDFAQWGNGNKFKWQSAGGNSWAPGDMFSEVLDVSNLRDVTTKVAYDGHFDLYQGWRNAPACLDGYHGNWCDKSENRHTMTTTDIRNMPTVGWSSYTQTAGVVKQQYDNRLTGTGDGLGTVAASAGSPAWVSTVFTGAASTPTAPVVSFSPTGTIYTGEDTAQQITATASWDGKCMAPLRIHRQLTGAGAASFSFESADQVEWDANADGAGPDAMTWSNAKLADYTQINGVGGRAGALSSSVQSGPDHPNNPTYGPAYTKAVFRLQLTGGPFAPGTKDATLALTSASSAVPQWEYPLGSGTYAALAAVSSTLSVKGIPIVDYPEVGWTSSSTDVPNPQNGQKVLLVIRRKRDNSSLNSDAMGLATTVPIIYSYAPLGGGSGNITGPATVTFPSNPTQTQETQTVEVTLNGVIEAGDIGFVRVDWANGTHVQAPTFGHSEGTDFEEHQLIFSGSGGDNRPDRGNTGSRIVYDPATWWDYSSSNSGNPPNGHITQAWWDWAVVNQPTHAYIDGATGRKTLSTIRVNGVFRIEIDDLVIEDCIVDAGDAINFASSNYCVDNGKEGTGGLNLLVQYCTLHDPFSACVIGSNMTISRCYMHHSSSDFCKSTPGVTGSKGNIIIEDCFMEIAPVIDSQFWDQAYGAGNNPHSDGYQDDGAATNVTYRRNRILGPYPLTAGDPDVTFPFNTAFLCKTNGGTASGYTIEGNWFEGGGYPITLLIAGGGSFTNVTIRDNFFRAKYNDPDNLDGWGTQFGSLSFSNQDTGIPIDYINDATILVTGNRWDPQGNYADPTRRNRLITAGDDGGFAQE